LYEVLCNLNFFLKTLTIFSSLSIASSLISLSQLFCDCLNFLCIFLSLVKTFFLVA
jgi:hypothetical protein